MTKNIKMDWAQPKVTLLGDVESLTQQKTKHFGGNDGFIVQNNAISG